MRELEFPGMQEMPLEAFPFSIERISRNRMAKVLEMDAYLVGSAGARHAGHQGPVVADSQQLVIGDGVAAGGRAAGSHLLALDRMTPDGQIDGSLGMAGTSPDDGNIGFLYLSVGKLSREGGMGLIVFGDHDAAAGLLVETMDDSGTMFLGTGGE